MKRHLRCIPYLSIYLALFVVTVPGVRADNFQLELKKVSEGSLMMSDPSQSDYLYRRSMGQYFYFDPDGTRGYPVKVKFSERVKKDRDTYESKYPLKGVFQIGKDDFIFALDSDNLRSNGYNQLYFDLNHNGDLTDETVIKAKALPEGIRFGEGSSQREFPILEVTLSLDGVQFAYSFFLSAYSQVQSSSEPPDFARANLNSAVYREGDVELDGKKHRVILLDFNSNGRFDDEFGVNNQGDRIYPVFGDKLFVDPDSRNRNAGSYLADRADTYPVAKLIGLEGKYYNLSVLADGSRLTLTPSTIPTGMVKNPNKRFYAVFYGDKGLVKIHGESEREIAMPEGDWQLLEYTIDASEGDVNSRSQSGLTLVAAAGTKKSPVVKVRKGETALLLFGPPFKPLVEIQGENRVDGNRSVLLGLLLQGSGEEICRDLRVNGRTPEQPSFVIATKNNEIVERGAFEYG